MSYVIEAARLTKRYGSLIALDEVDLRVECGAACGVVGGRGAGKTTLVRLLAGLSVPTRGAVRIFGHPPDPLDPRLRRRIGVMPEEAALFDYLTAAEYLAFRGREGLLPRAVSRERAAELLELLELNRTAEAVIAELSPSMRRRLALAAALVHRPEVLILDEPFGDLNEPSRARVGDAIGRAAEPGVTLLVTASSPEPLEEICGATAVLDRGRIVAQSGSSGPIRAPDAAVSSRPSE